MGTMLFERGLKPSDCPEIFNLNNIDILKEIAQSYLDAGADIIQTNTFGASPLKLASYKLENRTEEINRNAINTVKSVIKNQAYISASVGPSGKLLEPYGEISKETMYENFHTQLKIIIEEGIDIIFIETMSDINEALIALKAAKDINNKIPVSVLMVFDKTERGYYTFMGVSSKDAVNELIKSGADVIGSNCGYGIFEMVEIAKEFRKCTDFPLIIQSNAGIPKLENDKLIFPESPEFMAGYIKELIGLKCNIIGGCCGTNPKYTRIFRKVIDETIK
jgi:5-methyltetrahydrofolate--homocysteine methyltransferase